MAGSVNGNHSAVGPGINYETVSQVDEFCKALRGKRPIHSILIANNGMAAVKFIRSVRTWAYETFGTEKAILLVGMATPEDMRINAEHIRIADQFVEVPGGTNNNNYANVQLIVEVNPTFGNYYYLNYRVLLYRTHVLSSISAMKFWSLELFFIHLNIFVYNLCADG